MTPTEEFRQYLQVARGGDHPGVTPDEAEATVRAILTRASHYRGAIEFDDPLKSVRGLRKALATAP